MGLVPPPRRPVGKLPLFIGLAGEGTTLTGAIRVTRLLPCLK